MVMLNENELKETIHLIERIESSAQRMVNLLHDINQQLSHCIEQIRDERFEDRFAKYLDNK